MATVNPDLYEAAGKTWNIDPALLRAVAKTESGEKTEAVGPMTKYGTAKGSMQFIDDTARSYGVGDPHDPVHAVYGAAHYLSDLLQQNKGDVNAALLQYNGSRGDASATYAHQVMGNYDTSWRQPVKPADKAPAAPATPAPAAAAPAAAPVPDVDSELVGMRSPAPAPPVAAAPPPAPAAVPVVAPAPDPDAELAGMRSPAPATAPAVGPAAAATAPPPPAAPAAPSALTTMINPAAVPAGGTAQPVLGMPLVQSVGAGLVQGGRDVAQTVGGWLAPIAKSVNTAVPALARLDAATGVDLTAATGRLADQTNAFNTQYDQDTPAQFGRIGGQIAATAPALGGLGGIVGEGIGAAVTAAGRIIPAIGRAIPAVSRILSSAGSGAVAGGGTNLLVSGGTGEDAGNALATGALGGGVLGGAGSLIGAGLSKLSGGATSAIQMIADRLGIDLSTGQKLGGIAKRVEDVGQVVPGSGAAKFATQQNSQVASALEKEMGVVNPTGKIDTTSLNAARQAAGDRIENAAARIDVPGDQSFFTNMSKTEANAQVSGADAPQAKTFAKLSDRIMNIMSNNNGTMPGSELQKFIAKGGELDTALNSSNHEVADVAASIKDHLLNSGASSSSASAEAVQDLQKARYQYKVAKTIEPAVTKTADGSDSMSLQGLKQNIFRNFGTTGTGPGNNMQDLARLIEGIKPLPSSGTAERLAMYGALGIGGAGAAGAVPYAMMHPDQAENYALEYGPYAVAMALGNRALRFGSSGLVGSTAAKLTNPLLPRLAGPRVGNMLMQPQKPNQLATP